MMFLTRARTIMSAGACAMLIVSVRLHGQTMADLAPGSRVSITLGDSLRKRPAAASWHSVTGQLVRATQDSLYLEIRGAAPFGVARGEIRQVYVSRGVSRKRSAYFQSSLALLAGALIFGPLHGDDTDTTERFGLTMLAGGVGAVYGALRPVEQWKRLRN